MRMFRSLAPIVLLALAGCGTLSSAPPPIVEPATGVVRSVEQDGKFISLAGPQRPHGEPFLGVPGTNYFLLRSLIDTRNGEISHQLYVEDSYFGAKRNWETARDKAGTQLRFVEISNNEITCNPDCSYAEEFAAALPEAMLRANPQGFSVTFTAKAGNRTTLMVPGEMVAKQLAAVDDARVTLPQAAAAPAPPR